MEERGENKLKIIHFGELYAKYLTGYSAADYPDFEILIDNEILVVHRIILASRNKAFQRMLDDAKLLENRLEITDCDPKMFKVFLATLYTEQVNLKDANFDLLMIAEKFSDSWLKEKCIKQLINNISMENIVETQQLALKFNFEKLITACQKFAAENFENLIGTPKLQEIFKHNKFTVGIFKDYPEECATAMKQSNELLIKSKIPKTYKFNLGGLDLLVAKCPECHSYFDYCGCGWGNWEGIPRRRVHWCRFFAEDIEWSIRPSLIYDKDFGITLKAVGSKNVRADVRMTVFSYDPKYPNIKIEKRNKLYGEQLFEVCEGEYEEYSYDDHFKPPEAYVLDYNYFTVELTIDVLKIGK